jgi:hypothetical protein
MNTFNRVDATNVHFKRRLSERYNIIINHIIRNDLIDIIKNKKAVLLLKQSHNRSLFKIPITESVRMKNPNISCSYIMVVFDYRLNRIVTAIPYTDEQLKLILRKREKQILIDYGIR